MQRFLLTVLFFFSCLHAQARHVESAIPAQKPHIGLSGNFCPNMHLENSVYLIEVQQGYILFLVEKSCQPLYPLGYVDGYSLYAGYFAQGFGLDPMGTRTGTYDPNNKIIHDAWTRGKSDEEGRRNTEGFVMVVAVMLPVDEAAAIFYLGGKLVTKWGGAICKGGKQFYTWAKVKIAGDVAKEGAEKAVKEAVEKTVKETAEDLTEKAAKESAKKSNRTHRELIEDFKNNPGDWERKSAQAGETTVGRHKGATNIESQWVNKKTGEKVNTHEVIDSPRGNPHPENISPNLPAGGAIRPAGKAKEIK